MLSGEVIIGIASAVLAVGLLISWLIYRHYHVSFYKEEQSTEISGIHFSKEMYPSKSYDIDFLIKPDEELRKLFFANPDHESTYRSILKNTELIKKIRSSKSEDDARKILIDWLRSHQSEKDSKGKKDTGPEASKKKDNLPDGKIKPLAGKEKSSKKEILLDEKSIKQEPLAVKKDIVPISPKVIETYREIVKLLDEHNIERIVTFLRQVPDATIKLIIQDYARVRVAINSPKADILFARAKSKNDIIMSIEQEMVNSIKERFESLRERISQLRKKGIDVKNEDLLLGMIQPKIKAFSLTLEKADLAKVWESIKGLDNEISSKEGLLNKK